MNSHTPWDFNIGNQQFFSPDHSQSLRYQVDSFIEIGMGGPLYGACFWVAPNCKEVLLHTHCGGPPVWQQQGNCVAIPIWKFSRFSSWTVHIGVLELANKKLIVFKKSFQVLLLEQFDKYLITGVDSPIYCPKTLHFDAFTAAIERIISL